MGETPRMNLDYNIRLFSKLLPTDGNKNNELFELHGLVIRDFTINIL